MKQLSIEEKQKVYEYLLKKDCPDLLAALIAERSEETVEWHQEIYVDGEPLTIGDVLGGAFFWDASPEGDEFWRTLWKEIEDYPEDEVADDENTEYKIEVPVLSPVFTPTQPEKSGVVSTLKDFILEYKYLLGIVSSVAAGAAVGLRYTGVI